MHIKLHKLRFTLLPESVPQLNIKNNNNGLIFFFLPGPQPWHMEVPKIGVELEL